MARARAKTETRHGGPRRVGVPEVHAGPGQSGRLVASRRPLKMVLVPALPAGRGKQPGAHDRGQVGLVDLPQLPFQRDAAAAGLEIAQFIGLLVEPVTDGKISPSKMESLRSQRVSARRGPAQSIVAAPPAGPGMARAPGAAPRRPRR